MTELMNGISWSIYIIIVVTALAGYYAVVGLLYYKQEIRALLSGKGKPSKDKEEVEDDREEGSFEELEAVVLDVRSNILEKAGNQVSKTDLLARLQSRLTSYGGLRQPAYRVAVNNFIIREAAASCGIDFSEEELNEAWEELAR